MIGVYTIQVSMVTYGGIMVTDIYGLFSKKECSHQAKRKFVRLHQQHYGYVFDWLIFEMNVQSFSVYYSGVTMTTTKTARFSNKIFFIFLFFLYYRNLLFIKILCILDMYYGYDEIKWKYSIRSVLNTWHWFYSLF